MNKRATSARATLDAWRKQHADLFDPVRFRFIDALATRAAGHEGETRRILDHRLSTLVAAYAADLKKAASRKKPTAPSLPDRAALAGLLDHIASHAATRGDRSQTPDAEPRSIVLPELEALDEFRKTWSGIRSRHQLRQSLEPVSADAGPLNSTALVHRSIALMHELSPGYLDHFLAYVDALSWMEQINASGASAASSGKRTRGKPRR